MKNSICIVILLLSYSCNSQSSIEDELKGNWYPGYLGDLNEDYTEFYIDKDKIYYFNLLSETITKSDYYISDSFLFLKKNQQKEFEKMGSIYILNDTLYIENQGTKSFFLKQMSTPTLESFIKKKVDLDDFFDAYLKRITTWNENKS
ncbi:hypothetical protein KIM67_07020 [Flagellimonas sp. 389]|uniref:hypothetical protein n=1 Tax=Flagellimonas sp. 389 TaxID=2835862 RepID=UPI001BD2F9D5|nr:hypothetical protein [Flagellimonas sp. 389]MBS9462156.1 hypothetical protein [Flagellimonas sp. 389]